MFDYRSPAREPRNLEMKRSVPDPAAAVNDLADPAFATDERQRIVSWNRAAEKLLGFSAEEVRRRPCHEIVCGTDLFGNPVCDADCTFNRMARRREPIASFEMCVRKADGERVSVAVSAVLLRDRDPSRWIQVHLFRPIGRDCETAALLGRLIGWAAVTPGPVGRPDPTDSSRPSLTGREIEVLRRLAEGKRTESVADELCVSVATVRTHVRNILTKLEAHSRLEAVATALRKHLI